MKVGVDLHGVLDTNPEFFKAFIDTLMSQGHEVHIVSGCKASDMLKFLQKHKIKYDFIYSITTDFLTRTIPLPFKLDKNKNPYFASKDWDKAKAVYCQNYELDMMIDDTLLYGKHFKTPFFLFKRMK